MFLGFRFLLSGEESTKVYFQLKESNFQGGGSDVVSVSCFGVRFSVMFHFMCVHYTFSSV